jgi:outer membrane protein assembly factor BamB
VPGNGNCRASLEQSANGYVVLLGGDEWGVCTRLTAVDLTAGTAAWTRDIAPIDGGAGKRDLLPAGKHRPVVVGDNVYVATEQGGQMFSVLDGSQPTPHTPSSCFTTAFLAIADTLLAKRDCASSTTEDRPGLHLAAFDSAQNPLWRWVLPEDETELELNGVLSVDPLVVVVDSDDATEVWRVEPGSAAGDDPGQHTVLASTTGVGEFMRPCGYQTTPLEPCPRALVGDGVLYLQSILDENGQQKGMLALDLTTGEELWHARPDGELSIAPLGLDENGRLVALQFQSPEQRGVVVSVAPADGSLTPLVGLPPRDQLSSDGTRNLVENSDLDEELSWHDGHLAFLNLAPEVTSAAGSPATVVYT